MNSLTYTDFMSYICHAEFSEFIFVCVKTVLKLSLSAPVRKQDDSNSRREGKPYLFYSDF